jgi:hypothetical protein
MAKKTEFDLSLVIKAVDKATGPIKSIQKSFEGFTKPLKHLVEAEAFKLFGEALSKVGEAAGEAFEKVHKIFELVENSAKTGAELEHTSKRLGLTVDQFAQLRFAAGQAGVDQEGFTAAMDKFNKSLGEGKAGTGNLLKFLNRVSPAFAQQVVHAKDTKSAFDLVVKAMTKVQDPAKRAALASAIFGRGNVRMAQFLSQGSKAIEEQEKRFFDLAGSQDDLAKGGEEFEKSLNETNAAFEGLKNAAIAPLLPVFAEFAKAIADFLAKHRDGLKKWAEETGKAIGDWIRGGGLDRLMTTLGDIAKVVGDVIVALGGFKAIAVIIAAWIGGPLVLALGGLVLAAKALVVALAPVALTLGAVALAAVGVGAAAYEIYKNWQPLKEFFVELGDSVTNAFDRIETRIKHASDAVGGFKNLIEHPFASAFNVGASLTKDSLTEVQQHSSLTPERFRAVQRQQAEAQAHVTVDFKNVPKGVRVQRDPGSTAKTELKLGHAMAEAQ